MKQQFWSRWGMRLWMIVGVSLALAACVQIDGNAEVSDKGRVKITTTYDFLKVYDNIKGSNPALANMVEESNCKIFVSSSPNFKCDQDGSLKFKISDEMDKPAGVVYDEGKGELSFDAMQYFAQVTDLKKIVQRDGAQSIIGDNIPPFLPLQAKNRQRYLDEGMHIVLHVKFANDIVRVDGQNVNGKGREMTINFMDLMDKPSYIIVTRAKAGVAWGRWLFALLVLALLLLAVWFLKKTKQSPPTPPDGMAVDSPDTPSGGGSEMDADVAIGGGLNATTNTGKTGKGERLAQVFSAAAVGVGSAAVGGGANHTIEEVLHKEPSVPTPAAEVEDTVTNAEIEITKKIEAFKQSDDVGESKPNE